MEINKSKIGIDILIEMMKGGYLTINETGTDFLYTPVQPVTADGLRFLQSHFTVKQIGNSEAGCTIMLEPND